MTEIDLENLRNWVGREEESEDLIAPGPAAAMHAALDLSGPAPAIGNLLPIPWHWLYFLPKVPASLLDTDGHALRGGFLPPVPLPGRVWGGSRISYHSPLTIGGTARKTSTIKSVDKKGSDENPLIIVTVQHDITVNDSLSVREEQDIIYRGATAAGASKASQASETPEAQWTKEVMPNTVLLFRYSALTFNSHRIHYDREYATGSEGYPGLVVHGPLTATLLLATLQPAIGISHPTSVTIRAARALFDTDAFSLNGRRDDDRATLWAAGPNNAKSMTIQVNYASRQAAE